MTETETTELAPSLGSGPFGSLDDWFDDLAGRIDRAFGIAPPGPRGPARKPFRAARTDITDTGPSYRLVAELPGVPKEKLQVQVRGAEVEIRAEFDGAPAAEGSTTLFQERWHRGYYRSVELPEPVIGANARATLADGVLTLELPKEHPEPVPAVVKVPVQ